ncbi:MAG TPA: DUF1802 family protein [Thermoanaerobaculia bacterium]|nr:DUF1802 family protein [Thermoanaerobaculia bacterium]
MKLSNHTALKEWSTVIDALAAGEQIILLRKGGIADPKFGLEAERFYLYPTYFHQADREAEEHVTITAWCEVMKIWRVRDESMLDRVASLVAMPRDAVATRYRFRPDQALHVIAVLTWRLPQPARITVKPEYAGCRSWISIDDEIDVDGSVAALDGPDFLEQLSALDRLSDSTAPVVDAVSANRG